MVGAAMKKRDEEIRCSREKAAVALRSDAVGLFVVVVVFVPFVQVLAASVLLLRANI